MNILVVSKYAPVPGYGSNPRWFNLGKKFSEFGYNVCIVTSDSNHGSAYRVESSKFSNFTEENVNFFIIKTLKYNKTNSLLRVLSWFDFDIKLFRYCGHMKPDVVVISSLSLTSIIFGLFLKAFRRSCFVFEVRDIWPLTMIVEGGFSSWNPLALYLRMLEVLSYSRADLIVGTMPNLKQHVGESGVHREASHFHTCGIGVSTKRIDLDNDFEFNSTIERKIIGKTLVGYCGSIGLTNNLSNFIDYIAQCDRHDVVFIIAGDGAFRQQFEKKLAETDNVFFLGKIPPEQVQGFLRRCNILFLSTLPSKVWDYGQSMNKVVDYMLAAKYIVAQYTGHPSFINEAKCGIFTDAAGLKDCLNAALEMPPAERDAAGLAGREWLLKHQSYQKLARDYLRKIESCVKDRT